MKDLYFTGDDYVYFFINNLFKFTLLFLTFYYYFFSPCSFPLR